MHFASSVCKNTNLNDGLPNSETDSYKSQNSRNLDGANQFNLNLVTKSPEDDEIVTMKNERKRKRVLGKGKEEKEYRECRSYTEPLYLGIGV